MQVESEVTQARSEAWQWESLLSYTCWGNIHAILPELKGSLDIFYINSIDAEDVLAHKCLGGCAGPRKRASLGGLVYVYRGRHFTRGGHFDCLMLADMCRKFG